jgi:ribosomal protein S12 methylthiotransferase
VSLGCPKNLVDSEVMMGLLATGGAEITARAEDADVIVVNTCAFIDSAKQESVNAILEMAEQKTAGRARKLIVAGCLVERYRNEIQIDIPEVDAVVGTAGFAVRHPERARRRRGARTGGALLAGGVAGRHRRSASLPDGREHSAGAGDAPARGVHQDRGRLRSSVRVLHHSATAGQVPLAAL